VTVSSNTDTRALPGEPESRTGTQSIRRAALLVRIIAARSRTGVRLTEVVQHAHLERSTARRILKCLVAEGFVMQDDASHRYFLGPLAFELGLAAAPRFNIVDICRESLARIAERTGDTVFLIVRSGYDSVCVDRKEGSFPIKTLTLDIGTRRPLGAGAGGLALLMGLPDDAVDEIASANALRLAAYNGLNVPSLMRLLRRARTLGYALNDIHITPGASSVALPVRSRFGSAFAAVSVGAISSRMKAERQREIATILRAEIASLEGPANEATQP
jgi:DNA-binding IclR family transcriptional regulator